MPSRTAVAAILFVGLVFLPPVGRAEGSTCRGFPVTISGTAGPDDLRGTPGDDVIAGLEGDDLIRGLGGHDVFCGDGGDDRIIPGRGRDIVDGGVGTDVLSYHDSRFPVLVDLHRGNAIGNGVDRVIAVERVVGSEYGDVLIGGAEADRLDGGSGDDRLLGGDGGDYLSGGPGDDEVLGGPGFDLVDGAGGSDLCDGESTSSCASGLPRPAVFVSTGGDDHGDGNTPQTAVRTLQRAVHLIGGGGTVFVLPGRYREGLSLDGELPDTPIRIAGVGGRPILDGEETRTLGIFCHGCRGLIVEWLRVVGFTDIGVGATLSTGVGLRHLRVVGNGHRVQLTGWELEGYGIHVDESIGVVIEDSQLSDNGPTPPRPGLLLGTAINTFGNRDVIIRRNRAHHNHGAGILVEDSVGVLVEANEVFENDLDASIEGWWDGGIWIDGGAAVVIRANVVRDNQGVGIELSDEERQSPTGYVLENNVSTGNYWGIFVWNFETTAWPDSSIVLLGTGNTFDGNLCGDVWIAPRSDYAPCP